MAIKKTHLSFLLVLCLFLASALLCFGSAEWKNPEDPREVLKECRERCHGRGFEGQEQECEQRCLKECRERCHWRGWEGRERECEQGCEDQSRHQQQQHEQCQQGCKQRYGRGQEQQLCKLRCLQYYEGNPEEETSREEEGRETSNNPYFFHEQRFKSRIRSREGQYRVLGRFSERSELLRGIDNYRLAIIVANPNSFVIPHHMDAETVLVVLRGQGTISFARQERGESYNLERGDVIRVPAGTTMYLINRHNNEKLHVAKLFQPIFTPGRYREYYGAGGENPKSFYRVFSNEVLEAAMNTPQDELDKLFGRQRQGAIIRGTQEQIKALSQHASSARQKGHGESRGPINVLNERPKYSNNFGRLFEASPDEYRQLQDMDVSVSFVNINQGAMMAPYYNSRSTRLVLVIDGSGRFEMACPHLARQSQRSQGEEEGRREQGEEEEERGDVEYQKVSSKFSPGDVFIIPAGHPVAILASQNENLLLVSFGINARNNERHFLAGQENIINHLEKEAKELSFNMPAREVEEKFRNQKESHFVAGPGQRQQQRKGEKDQVLNSILDNIGGF